MNKNKSLKSLYEAFVIAQLDRNIFRSHIGSRSGKVAPIRTYSNSSLVRAYRTFMPPKRPSWRRNVLEMSGSANRDEVPFMAFTGPGFRLGQNGEIVAPSTQLQSGRASSSTREEGVEVQPPITQPQIFDNHADQVDACEVISVGCHTMLDMIEEWSLALPEHLRREKLGQEIDKLKQDATMLIAKGEDVLQYGCVLDTANLCSLCVAQYERLKDNYKGLKHECQPFLSSARKRARNAD